MFNVGDIVCHRASFLRSIGWHTNVPINGRVKQVHDGSPLRLTVEWSDGETQCIVASNVILESRKHLEAV